MITTLLIFGAFAGIAAGVLSMYWSTVVSAAGAIWTTGTGTLGVIVAAYTGFADAVHRGLSFSILQYPGSVMLVVGLSLVIIISVYNILRHEDLLR